MGPNADDIMALIRRAPWREAVTYRDTWPHEYVVVKKDGQEDLLAAFCERIARGEGVECQFFGQKRQYLFLDEHKYWIMTECSQIDLEAADEVLNRALLYRDRRDFVIKHGDTGTRKEDPKMANSKDEFEQLDVRTMWKDEARDFTPWLAENINVLGDALGMKLETVQMELPIGRYFLDILARETDEDVKVAIENQLEETDLLHLGQLLTYATGCGAGIAIWVAPEFGYELARALHKLNEWSDDSIRFYGVKVEYVREHGVETAEPRFRVVVSPGGWNKELTLTLEEMSPDKRRHHEFFQPLEAKLLADDFADSCHQYYDHTSRLFPSRVNKGFGYAAYFYRANSAWVTLNIPTENKEQDKEVFDKLKACQDQIEASVDAGPNPEWHWSRHDRYFYSAISVRRDGSISDSPDKLEETRTWMLDLLPKFKAAFDPCLEETLGPKSRAGKDQPRMSYISSVIQTHAADGVDLVEALLARPQVPFQGRTVEAPDESGIYLLSERRTSEPLYVGQTGKGIKSRLRDHWDGNASSDISMRLVEDGVVEKITEGRKWIVDNVAIRWMTADELGTRSNWAEHFAIVVLRPKFNK